MDAPAHLLSPDRLVKDASLAVVHSAVTTSVQPQYDLRVSLVFENGCRLVSKARGYDGELFWKATGHALECVRTLQSSKIGYILETTELRENEICKSLVGGR